MNTITDVILKVLPNIEIGIQAAARSRVASAIDTVKDLHLAVFWLRAAEKELAIAQDEDVTVLSTNEVTAKQLFTLPTFFGVNDRLDHLSTTLTELTKQLEVFKEELVVPQNVKYKVDRGYDKLMEAEMNNDLTKQYYGELNRE